MLDTGSPCGGKNATSGVLEYPGISDSLTWVSSGSSSVISCVIWSSVSTSSSSSGTAFLLRQQGVRTRYGG